MPCVVVKRFDGDRLRDLWYERLRRGRSRSPGRREFETLEVLAQEGLSVPSPIAWAEAGGGRSLVVMKLVPHRESLRQRLERVPQDSRRWLPELARLVARLHAAGWYHRDLYLEHVVLAEGENEQSNQELLLLDLGRARRERSPRRRWFVKDLAALSHSTPAGVSRADRLRFLEAYLAARGIPRSARRPWVAAVFRRERRLAAHLPRHVDSSSAEGGVG